ncbi:MAG: hypothetical protein JWN63_2011 [Candidatus Acidoferrum typicum]|nr:hypothetical protein [Candidatus Acidoferrum typicum]
MKGRVGRVEERERIVDVGAGADGAKDDLWLEGFLLPNSYSPAQTLAVGCRRDRGKQLAFNKHQDRYSSLRLIHLRK